MINCYLFYKGYILDSIGPYLANNSNNDANMTKHIIEKQMSFKNYFHEGDVFIVDRGFRDCVSYLNDLGLKVEIPHFLKDKDQHTTQEANETRLVTKTRWVVESANGIIKKWLYFNNVVPNSNIPHIESDFKIVCALINKYKPFRCKNQSANEDKMAQLMLKKLNEKNTLIDKIAAHKRKRFKNTKSYTREHLNENGLYEFELIPENKNFIKIKLNSRHSSSTIYTLFIEIDRNTHSDPIKAYYCDCKVGARTIGCCAHIASALWYFGIAIHDSKLLKPTFSTKLYSFCKDASS